MIIERQLQQWLLRTAQRGVSSIVPVYLPAPAAVKPQHEQSPWSSGGYRSTGRKHKLRMKYVWKAPGGAQGTMMYTFRMGTRRHPPPAWREHPTTVSVENGYFTSPHPHILWDKVNEAWEVMWYEHNKLNGKPFLVRHYGVRGAKKAAMAFVAILRKAIGDSAFEPPKRYSKHPNVHYDEVLQAWGTTFYLRGKPVARYYASGKYGFERARQIAHATGRQASRRQRFEYRCIREAFLPVNN